MDYDPDFNNLYKHKEVERRGISMAMAGGIVKEAGPMRHKA